MGNLASICTEPIFIQQFNVCRAYAFSVPA